jgi:hypothetical protein
LFQERYHEGNAGFEQSDLSQVKQGAELTCMFHSGTVSEEARKGYLQGFLFLGKVSRVSEERQDDLTPCWFSDFIIRLHEQLHQVGSAWPPTKAIATF